MSFEVQVRVTPGETGVALFGPLAFDGQIGKTVPVADGHGTLVAATVAPDGTFADLRLALDGRVVDYLRPKIQPRYFSIADRL